MEAVQQIFSAVGSWFAKLFGGAGTQGRSQFLLIGGIVLAVLVIVIIIIARRLAAARRRQSRVPSGVTTLLPVESSGADFETIMLPLADRIATAEDHLEPVLVERLRKDAPLSLKTVVAGYERAGSEAQADLLALVRSERLMERYAEHLGEEGYNVGTLAQAWRFFPDDQVLQGYVEMLSSPDEETQHWAVRLLGALQEPKMLPLLVLTLVRPDIYLPTRVAEAFATMPAESASLLTYMLPDIEDRHKAAVLDIIRQTEADFDPKNVLECLRNKEPRIRAAAALALGSSHIAEALPHLLLAANDKRWQVRAAIAKALGLLGDSRAIPCLEGLARDTEGWVAESAKQALQLFHGA